MSERIYRDAPHHQNLRKAAEDYLKAHGCNPATWKVVNIPHHTQLLVTPRAGRWGQIPEEEKARFWDATSPYRTYWEWDAQGARIGYAHVPDISAVTIALETEENAKKRPSGQQQLT